MNQSENSKTNPLIRLLIDVGPLVIFFIANAREGIFFATGAFMVAIMISVSISFVLERKLPIMPVVTAGVVLVFGGLTIYLQDELFIKLKPTIVNTLFGFTILVGLKMRRNFIKILLGTVMQLNDEGWNRLAIRWAGFFFLLAVLNEIVWRNFSTDTWVAFKVFGIMPLTVLFSIAQVPLITKFPADTESNE